MNKIKIEAGNEMDEHHESGLKVDAARELFESALNELLNNDSTFSESDNESNPDAGIKERILAENGDFAELMQENEVKSILPHHRPFKKKRRKELDPKDAAAGFHHTFVMRMFDRSVDLAQFGDTCPLYPICRAWMLNEPLNADQHKIKLTSIYDSYEDEDRLDHEENDLLTSLPKPISWPPPSADEGRADLRVPSPLPFPPIKRLDRANEELHISPAVLLTEHLYRWRTIRNRWKIAGQEADMRYQDSYDILKTMFDR